MSWVYRRVLRPFLFAQDAERIHEHTLRGLAWASRQPLICEALEAVCGASPLPVEVFGLKFPNPVGLAAGMDKYAAAVPAWRALGFGFAELGAATWHAQPGNPPPRLVRIIPDEAIINRMGFNNPGAEEVARKLAEWRAQGSWPNHPVGINLGKSKITPLEQAPEDYANSLRVLWPHADFFVVNVSSPNTPNLRQLQDRAALDEILAAVQRVQATLCSVSNTNSRAGQDSKTGVAAPKPILVKVAPDLTFEALDEMLELVTPRNVAGIIATNTTIMRPEVGDPKLQQLYAENGGLSGRPLRQRSTEVVRHLYRQTRGTLPIIGVGGIFSAADAWEKIAAGASLIQIYTGLVYNGPTLVKAVVRGLSEQMRARSIHNIAQAVGCEVSGA